MLSQKFLSKCQKKFYYLCFLRTWKSNRKIICHQGLECDSNHAKSGKETALNNLSKVNLVRLDVGNAQQIIEVAKTVLEKGDVDVDVVFNYAG